MKFSGIAAAVIITAAGASAGKIQSGYETSLYPKPAGKPTSPEPAVEIESPAPEVNTTSPGPFVNTTSPGPFVNTTSPGPFVNTTSPGPFVNTTSPGPFVNTTSPGPFVNTTSPGSLVTRSTVNTTSPVVNTTSPFVNTTSPIVNTTSPFVNNTSPDSVVGPEIPEPEPGLGPEIPEPEPGLDPTIPEPQPVLSDLSSLQKRQFSIEGIEEAIEIVEAILHEARRSKEEEYRGRRLSEAQDRQCPTTSANCDQCMDGALVVAVSEVFLCGTAGLATAVASSGAATVLAVAGFTACEGAVIGTYIEALANCRSLN